MSLPPMYGAVRAMEVIYIKETPNQHAGHSWCSRKTAKLVADYLAIEDKNAKEAGMLAFMARSMVMATLPHSKPEGHVFQRNNGHFTLTMIGNPKFGLPYGSLPRLLLAWMTREAKLTKSPTLHLGKSFSAFLRVLKLSRSGGIRGDATRLRDQMVKLFSTHVSCTYQNKKDGVCKADQFLVTKSFELWWDPLKDEGDEISQDSTITLAKDFFEELIDRPIPVDFRMLQALRRSPLQIDIYIWLTYRFSYLRKSTLIPWNLLSHQFGSNYASSDQGLRDFKREFLKALHVVRVVYQEANVEIQEEGIVLNPSRSHVKSSKKRSDLI